MFEKPRVQPALRASGPPTIGLAVGVFDRLHRGHLIFLRAARQRCDVLIVGLQLNPLAYKPVEIHDSYHQRFRRLALLQAIDRIVPYQHVDHLVQQLHFHRLFLGEDQRHPGFGRAVTHCRRRRIPVQRLARTPEISSTALRQGCFGRFTAVLPPAR